MGFEYKNETNLDQRKIILEQALNYLSDCKDKDGQAILNDQDAFEAIYCVAHTAAFYYVGKLDKNAFTNKNLETVFGNVLTFVYDYIKTNESFDFEIAIDWSSPQKDLLFDHKCVKAFQSIVYCLNIISSRDIVRLTIVINIVST